MNRPSLLLIGFGQLNTALATRIGDAYRVTAISRSRRTLTGIEHHAADLTQGFPAALANRHFDFAIHCLTPDGFADSAYEGVYDKALRHVIDGLGLQPPSRFFLVSSTSVYHQSTGEWVDESSPVMPSGFAGQRILAAERMLAEAPFPGTSIRFSGIYGGQRTRLLEQAQALLNQADLARPDLAQPDLAHAARETATTPIYSNRIHEVDAVGVMAHLLALAARGVPLKDCYLASDCEPASLGDVLAWIVERIGGAKANAISSLPGSAPPERRRSGSKRCSNARLRETGYHFQYPDYRSGYEEMIQRLLKI